MEFIKSLSKWTDTYEREARLAPGLIVLIPLFVCLVSFLGSKHPLLITVTSILMACGGPLLLSRIARDLGKSLEEKLFDKWGGKPSTILLRHSDVTIDSITKAEYHSTLSKLLGKPAPSIQEERENPDNADHFYRAAVTALIAKTQDIKKFSMLFKENKHYGFQRNIRGLKWIGIVLNLIILIIAGFLCAKNIQAPVDFNLVIEIKYLFPLLISSVFLLFWVLLATEASVRRSANAYADRLIRSCNSITLPRAKSPK